MLTNYLPRIKLNAGPANKPKFEKENTLAETADLRSISFC